MVLLDWTIVHGNDRISAHKEKREKTKWIDKEMRGTQRVRITRGNEKKDIAREK